MFSKTKIFLFYLAFGGVVLFFLSQYLFFDYDFLTGYDTGIYVLELNKYLWAPFYKEIQSFYQELGALSLLSGWSFIVNVDQSIDIYRFFMIFLSSLQILVLFAIFRRLLIFKIWLTLAITMIFVFSSVSVNHFYLFIFRQFSTTTFVWVIILLTLIIKPFSIRTLLLGYFLWIIFFFHKGTSSLVLPLIWFYILLSRGKIFDKMKYGFYIFFVAFLIYLPYLINYYQILVATVKDFFSMSIDNASWPYNQQTWVSFITWKVTAYKSTFFQKVFLEDRLFGLVNILLLSKLKKIRLLRKNLLMLMWWFLLFVLFFFDFNFSSRSTHFIFLAVCSLIAVVPVSYVIISLLLFSFVIDSVPNIIQKVPYLEERSDPGVQRLLTTIDKENSLIIALGSDNNIPAQLGYTTLDYISTFDVFYRKNFLLDPTFQKLPTKIFALWYKEFVPLPEFFQDKNIYIIIGTHKQIKFGYETVDLVPSWENSIYAEKIFSAPSSKRIKYVYLYKPQYAPE